MIRIAINGMGRIGKNFLRVVMQDQQASKALSIVALNIGPADKDALAHSFKYDTLMKTYMYDVTYKENTLTITDYFGVKHSIAVFAEKDPSYLPWAKLDIDWVVESSGKFTKREDAEKHKQAGAKAVLITAPAQGEDVTIIPGVNHQMYNAENHTIVALASCTTNALVPMLYVLDKAYGIEQAAMTTVHAYTNSQVLLDVDATSKDLRRSRAAAVNIVPTSTGAMETIGKIMPHLIGKISGCSLRVPVTTVSLIDITYILKTPATAQEINNAFEAAASSSMQTILGATWTPLVSSDYQGDSHSVVVDLLMTSAQAGGTMGKAFGWYDNEWGYSCRLKDFLMLLIN